MLGTADCHLSIHRYDNLFHVIGLPNAESEQGFEGVCHISKYLDCLHFLPQVALVMLPSSAKSHVNIGEETRNASVTVPRSMVLSIVINGIMAFGFIIGLLFSVTDIQSALDSPTNSPIVEILNSALQSTGATTVFMSLFILLAVCAEIGMIASTSRLTWAFARDNGLPFSRTFAYVCSTQSFPSVAPEGLANSPLRYMQVNPQYRIPINAILLNAVIAMLLNLINVASSTAFSAVISLTTLALYSSYMLPIGIMILRRLSKNKLQLGPFNLGRFGLLINILGILWGIFTVVFVVFPTEIPVTADNMNYSSLVFGAGVIFSIATWFIYGKSRYHGSVNELDENIGQAR